MTAQHSPDVPQDLDPVETREWIEALESTVAANGEARGLFPEAQLMHYRQEVAGNGLCSYPHPWLMPEVRQFPTGSMGIGPLNAIYHARFMRYLEHRSLADTAQRHV